MGVGNTGVACLDLGRHFIGFEIDKEYFKTAKTRLLDYNVTLKISQKETPFFSFPSSFNEV